MKMVEGHVYRGYDRCLQDKDIHRPLLPVGAVRKDRKRRRKLTKDQALFITQLVEGEYCHARRSHRDSKLLLDEHDAT
jgi:hypothetical protein